MNVSHLLLSFAFPLAALAAQEPSISPSPAPPSDGVARTTVLHDVRDLMPRWFPVTDPVTDRTNQRSKSVPLLREIPLLSDVFERDIAADVAKYEAELRARRHREAGLEEVVRMWRAFARPAFEGADRIEIVGAGQLAVHATAAHHQWLGELLRDQRAAGDGASLMIECTLLSAPKDAFTKAGLAPAVTYATADELAAMRARLNGAEFEVVSAPKLTTRDVQRATFSVLSSRSFIREYRLHYVGATRQAIADPVIDVAEEGIVMHARGMLLPGNEIGLHLAFESVS
jgi:hypothetical protein